MFNHDTTQAKITILQISGSEITTLASGTVSGTATSPYTYTADDGLYISVIGSASSSGAKITPPSGKALRYINFVQGSVGSLTTLAVDTTLSTYSTVYGNIVLVGYA